MANVDLIFYNGQVSTLDPNNQQAEAIAVSGDRIAQVGLNKEIIALKSSNTRVIDLNRRRVIPGLIDSHTHLIRGGLNYNMELRWDGLESLSDGLRMIREQAQRTPAPQWVRVVGGFTAHQFKEKRLPTIEELNQVAPDTPVFVLHLYDRALLNEAAVRFCGFTKDTPDPLGAEIARDKKGNPTGCLIARPNALILYSTLAKGPKLPFEYQLNSTKHFMRELNRLGITGVIDAGGGFQNFPDDYEVVDQLSKKDELTVRIAYNLFTQKPKGEIDDFSRWTKSVKLGQGDSFYKHNGAGEMLVYSAADFEDFRQPRPDMPTNMELDLEQVVRILVQNKWPFRLHATYDETISRALNVFEKVGKDVPFNGIHWFFDHAETISKKNMERIAALSGGIAVQHRMAYQGEYFVERYGAKAAEATPPIKEMLKMGLPVGAGTDATRVASYNPWMCLYWLVTGKTVAGTKIYPDENCLARDTALNLWTVNNTWFSNEDQVRGQIKEGQLADFVTLSEDYFSIDPELIKNITSVLTVVGGKVVHGEGQFREHSPKLPPPMPDWSPVRYYGGYQAANAQGSELQQHMNVSPIVGNRCCGVHPIQKRFRSSIEELVNDWSLGCMCWAF